MRRIFRTVVLVVWMLAGTVWMSRWWYANPDYFLHLPESFWRHLDQVFGVENVGGAKNVELLVVVMVSFLTVAAATAVVVATIRYVKREH